ncbi:MAG: FkbM family methyltransferase [Butyrivibrio sp.]|nr:FkbM family methyltransferase [Ruminococcus flavefaciens]MCM1560262.1 FkbM family methyltransferase [Butyrivibrio sp.]
MYKEGRYRVLIATPMYVEEVRGELQKFILKDDIYEFECELYYSFIHDLNSYRKFLIDNEAALLDFRQILQDELSRKTFECVLKGRITGNLSYFRECRRPDQYYIDELFDFAKQGVFLDVGASIGDTLEALAEKTNNSFEKVYCFEPSKEAFAILQEKALAYGNRVRLVNKGAWDRQETLEFQEDAEHGASKIATEERKNTIKVSVDRLDAMVDEADKVIHIKMDIEGAEGRAIMGAREIIRRNRPLLAICVYHKNDDFLEIPKLIKQIVPEYKFYLRHHNVSGTETVLYAVV